MEPEETIGASEEQTAPEGPNWALAGEALAAVTGLFPGGPITPEQGAEAEALLTKIQEKAAKFCRFGAWEKFKLPPRVDFEERYAQLLPLSDSDATDDLTEPDLIQAWEATVNRAREYLRARWPVIIRQTPTGPDWVEPSPTAAGLAATTLQVLERPLALLDAMNQGVATPSMFSAVREVYPELFERITGVFSLLLADARRTCPWGHEVQLRLLFDVDAGLMTFGTVKGEAPQAGGDIDVDFESLKTRNQQVR